MKILVLSYYNPWISGGGHRPVCFLEQDIFKGNEVVFLFESDVEVEIMKDFSLYNKDNLKLVRRIKDTGELLPMNKQASGITNEDVLLKEWKPDYVRSHNPVLTFTKLLIRCHELNIPHLYDQMDYWDGFPVQPWGEGSDNAYITLADACMTISNWLVDKNYKKTDKHFYMIPNGLKKTFLEQLYLSYEEVQSRQAEEVPTILYSGAIWPEWFDWNIVENLIENRPNYNFIFLGAYNPSIDEDDGRNVKEIVIRLRKNKNVQFIGQIPHTDLVPYLRKARVAIIPFVVNEVTEACSPLKCFEYLAASLPVVSTKLPEIIDYPNVYIAENLVDFLKCVDNAVLKEMSLDEYNRMNFFNQNNTWKTRSDQVAEIVKKEFNKV